MAEFNLFKEWARMVKANDHGLCTVDCKTCDFYEHATNIACASYVLLHPEEAEAIIRKWAEEHPRKTRQSEFLKLYPNARLSESGVLCICPLNVDNTTNCLNDCKQCQERYWKEEV